MPKALYVDLLPCPACALYFQESIDGKLSDAVHFGKAIAEDCACSTSAIKDALFDSLLDISRRNSLRESPELIAAEMRRLERR